MLKILYLALLTLWLRCHLEHSGAVKHVYVSINLTPADFCWICGCQLKFKTNLPHACLLSVGLKVELYIEQQV